MASIQDRYNPSQKAAVDTNGYLSVKGSGSGGSIPVTVGSGDELLILDDYTTTDVTYVCTAPLGSLSSEAVWKVFILDETGNFLLKKYADGDDSYDNIADNRASLSYL